MIHKQNVVPPTPHPQTCFELHFLLLQKLIQKRIHKILFDFRYIICWIHFWISFWSSFWSISFWRLFWTICRGAGEEVRWEAGMGNPSLSLETSVFRLVYVSKNGTLGPPGLLWVLLGVSWRLLGPLGGCRHGSSRGQCGGGVRWRRLAWGAVFGPLSAAGINSKENQSWGCICLLVSSQENEQDTDNEIERLDLGWIHRYDDYDLLWLQMTNMIGACHSSTIYKRSIM